jgi:hypothetical protein
LGHTLKIPQFFHDTGYFHAEDLILCPSNKEQGALTKGLASWLNLSKFWQAYLQDPCRESQSNSISWRYSVIEWLAMHKPSYMALPPYHIPGPAFVLLYSPLSGKRFHLIFALESQGGE